MADGAHPPEAQWWRFVRVLITGSAQGIGRALAIRLAGDGHTVLVHYRSSVESAERVVSEITDSGGEAHLVAADVTRAQEVEEMAMAVADLVGGLDGLINNVGGFVLKDFDDLTVEDWDYQIASTVSATYYVSRAMIPMLREGGGRIVNFSDSAADRLSARPRSLPYYVGKTGILILTKTMAVTEAPYGVTVNAIMPGVVENSDPAPDPARIPAGRYGTFEDIGGAVDFLLGESAGYVTGSFIQVGGGWNL
jgi:3-oxoacyl-[acyl-carrier protein] reductase